MKLLSRLVFWLTIKPRLFKLKKLLPEARIYPCGSRYVCNPPPLTTDVDFLVFSEIGVGTRLLAAGFSLTSIGYGVSPDFWCYRKGVINVISTSSERFVDRWNTATHICKSRNLLDKSHRIAVYSALRGEYDVALLPKDMNSSLKNLLYGLNGPYKAAIYAAYKIQHSLEK